MLLFLNFIEIWKASDPLQVQCTMRLRFFAGSLTILASLLAGTKIALAAPFCAQIHRLVVPAEVKTSSTDGGSLSLQDPQVISRIDGLIDLHRMRSSTSQIIFLDMFKFLTR